VTAYLRAQLLAKEAADPDSIRRGANEVRALLATEASLVEEALVGRSDLSAAIVPLPRDRVATLSSEVLYVLETRAFGRAVSGVSQRYRVDADQAARLRRDIGTSAFAVASVLLVVAASLHLLSRSMRLRLARIRAPVSGSSALGISGTRPTATFQPSVGPPPPARTNMQNGTGAGGGEALSDLDQGDTVPVPVVSARIVDFDLSRSHVEAGYVGTTCSSTLNVDVGGAGSDTSDSFD